MNSFITAMTRASDIFPNDNSDAKVKEVATWLISKGVKEFEPVSLFCDQLKKVRNLMKRGLHDVHTVTGNC